MRTSIALTHCGRTGTGGKPTSLGGAERRWQSERVPTARLTSSNREKLLEDGGTWSLSWSPEATLGYHEWNNHLALCKTTQ